MNQLEVLVEEKSMALILQVLLPKILPDGWIINENCFIRTHEGKQDLQHSIPNKLRAAARMRLNIGFIIIQDQDSDNCKNLKSKLLTLCHDALPNSRIPICIRIVCHELESWYLGDCIALERVFSRFRASDYQNKRLFRNPDDCVNPKQRLKSIVGEYPQVDTARRIAPLLDPSNNRSFCFRVFVQGVHSICKQLEEL